MQIECYGGDGFASNCYLLTDDAQRAAILVDPSTDPKALLQRRKKPLPPLRCIVLTHAHFDHMLCLDAWRRETGAPLAVHRDDAPALSNPTYNLFLLFTGKNTVFEPADLLLKEGDALPCAEESLRVLHTPGHTPGSICLAAGGLLLTGDTLFAGDIGRTDLPGGDTDALRLSLRRLGALSGNPLLYPGHGPSSFLQRERNDNPYME